MYRITNTSGELLGIVDTVHYIKIGASGDFAPTNKENAIGVALKGAAYNLIGHNEIANTDTVLVSAVDGGEYVTQQQQIIDELLLTILEG